MSPRHQAASVIWSDAPLSEIAAFLDRKRIKRIQIVEEGKLIGIVSRDNLIQALASTAEPTITAPDASTDQAIRARILDRPENQPWRDSVSAM
jgi:predicted transcriptional regulator